VDSVRKPLSVIVTHFPSDNGHVFYSVLAHTSIGLGGRYAFHAPSAAILFGIASIPLIYTMGRRVTTRFEALAGAMLATVAAYHVWFSQNARGYTILLVLTLLSTQLILNGLESRSRKPWLLFATVTALAVYTHVSMVLAVVGQAIAVALHLMVNRRFTAQELKGPVIGFAAAAALTIMLYLPMLGDVAGFFTAQATAPKPASGGFGMLDVFRYLQIDLVSGSVLIVGGARLPRWPRKLLASVTTHPGAILHAASDGLFRHGPARQAHATPLHFLRCRLLLLVGVRGVFVIIGFVLDRLGRAMREWERPARWAALTAMIALLVLDLSRTYGKPKMTMRAHLPMSRRPAVQAISSRWPGSARISSITTSMVSTCRG
jgi:4-amino-4-deoxy-L-arabinose transferase-like glycosyltransferase